MLPKSVWRRDSESSSPSSPRIRVSAGLPFLPSKYLLRSTVMIFPLSDWSLSLPPYVHGTKGSKPFCLFLLSGNPKNMVRIKASMVDFPASFAPTKTVSPAPIGPRRRFFRAPKASMSISLILIFGDYPKDESRNALPDVQCPPTRLPQDQCQAS